MCGIIGIISQSSVTSKILDGLSRLEYRGYDSAGIVTISEKNGFFERRRSIGNINNLEKLIIKDPISGNIGIGHTRWSTHGIPDEINAHPHMNKEVAVVHNGIIENYQEIKKNLLLKGYYFNSQTDTEVVVHLLTDLLLSDKKSIEESIEIILDKLHGSFALAILINKYPNQLIAIRKGSPLVIGYGDSANYISSDSSSITQWTRNICYLEDNDYATISRNNIFIYHKKNITNRTIHKLDYNENNYLKGDFPHFMLKEIFNQPRSLDNTIQDSVDFKKFLIKDLIPNILWNDINCLFIIACGSSYYASMVAKYWFEKFARLRVEVDIASEFRYRNNVWGNKNLYLFISQSGETTDTIEALNLAKKNGQKTLSIVNVKGSTMTRISDHSLYTSAGIEIGVASTKTFTAQLLMLYLLSLQAGRIRNFFSIEEEKFHIKELLYLPDHINNFLNKEVEIIENISLNLLNSKYCFYLGRSEYYPLALEGALKLKEVSYTYANGYPFGELKHGPLALIDENVRVIALVPNNNLLQKTINNIQEILSRKGKIICLVDQIGKMYLKQQIDINNNILLELPSSKNPFSEIIFYTITLQLFAYYTGVKKGASVDQPRNLAKSVTVE